MKKVLFVLSSHENLGDTNEKTGGGMSEASHPWKVLHDAGIIVDFASPRGGKPPVTGVDMDDDINKEFMSNQDVINKINNTLVPSHIPVHEYRAIHFVGGHGAMFDFPDNTSLNQLTADFFDNTKIVSAVCHGPAALLNVKLWNGAKLLRNRNVTCFTDAEERESKKIYEVPFLLQTEMMLRGCNFEIRPNWSDHVVVDGKLITGQNPQSALSVGKALLEII